MENPDDGFPLTLTWLMFEEVVLALWEEFIAGKAGGVWSSFSPTDSDIEETISLTIFVGLAFGVVSGDSSGEEILIWGTSEIAGTEAAESDVEFAESGNDDTCLSNGSCIDAGDTAGAVLDPNTLEDPDPLPLPPLLLPLLLSPRPAHKNAHTNDGKEPDRCDTAAAPAAEAGLDVEAST